MTLRSAYCLILIILLSFTSTYSQNLFVWSEIDPNWKKQSLNFWTEARGYSDRVKSEVNEIIEKEYTNSNNNLTFKFYEAFKSSNDYKNVEKADNPTAILLSDSNGYYLDLTVTVLSGYDDYPYYHGPTFSGEVEVQYLLNIYNAAGKLAGTIEERPVVNLKELRKSTNERLSYRLDAVGHSSLVDLTVDETISKIHKSFVKWDNENVARIEPNPKAFYESISFLFEKRINEYPGHYREFKIARGPSNIITQQTAPLPIESSEEQYAAYGDVNIAEEAGQVIRDVRNYALIIGVENYMDSRVNDLDNPINDAQQLMSVLTTNYTFNVEDVIFLRDPKRADIINALDQLASTINPSDNLLIFYAGHGLWDERLKTGYWFPSDARSDSRSNWFSNSELVGYIGGIQSRHTLLIADACFSGGIFKTREAFTGVTSATLELFKMPSRKAMTSGTMNTVPDRSVFIQYLVKRLKDNRKPFIASEDLFSSFKTAVINNSPNSQVPQYGEIRETGDEGGDFIFARRK